jgi:hypothetical protein
MLTAPGRTAVVANLGAGRSAALLTTAAPTPPAIWSTGRTRRSPAPYRDSGWLLPELLDQLEQAESVYFDSATQVRSDLLAPRLPATRTSPLRSPRGRPSCAPTSNPCNGPAAATPPNAPQQPPASLVA